MQDRVPGQRCHGERDHGLDDGLVDETRHAGDEQRPDHGDQTDDEHGKGCVSPH